MSQALYRKKRPRSLTDVVGQEHITETLARALKAGRVNHAYLFTGPRGVGKTSVARILAHEINKLPYSDTSNLDIIEIDAASNRRIDDIRDLREKVHITPIKTAYKIYIIDEVHMLTGESFNALLKTLEEPPSHVVFILATTESHKLPATIISRTQRFAFKPVNKEKVVAHLKQIAKQENIAIDDQALELVAEHGEGSFRDSIGLLDQLAHANSGSITAEAVERTLGLAPKSSLNTLVDNLLANDRQKAINSLAVLTAQGSNPGTLVNQICQALITHATKRPELYKLIDDLLEVPRSYNPSLKLLSTLAIFASQQSGQKPETKNAALAIKAAPLVSISKPAQVQKTVKNPTPEAEPTTELKKLTSDDWKNVLDETKKTNPPLYSVLKQAQPVLEDGSLLLKFKFTLHSKKLEDIKQKSLIAQIIKKTLGALPVIKTEVDKAAAPMTVASDPTVSSITAIMGGGEILNAEKL